MRGISIAAFGALGFCLVCPSALYAQQSPSALYEKYKRSVLQIETDRGRGTGFFIKRNDLVATAYHVIKDAAFIRLVRFGEGKRPEGVGSHLDNLIQDYNDSVAIKAVYVDPASDLAILQLNTAETVRHIPLGDHNTIKVGSQIAVIGTPLGLDSTLSVGIVSAKREKAGLQLIQFSAPVSSGSSGSPVIASSGFAVGVVSSQFAEGQSLNFAVSSAALGTLLTKKPIPLQDFLKKGKAVHAVSQELGRQQSISLSWLLKCQASVMVSMEDKSRFFVSLVKGLPDVTIERAGVGNENLRLELQSLLRRLETVNNDLRTVTTSYIRLGTQEILDRLEFGQEEASARRERSETSLQIEAAHLLFQAEQAYRAMNQAFIKEEWFNQTAFEEGMISSYGYSAAAAFYIKPKISWKCLPDDADIARIGWADADSPFKKRDQVSKVRIPGAPKAVSVLRWADIVKFIQSLPSDATAIEVQVSRSNPYGQELWIPCRIDR